MKTLKVGIANYEHFKARTMAIAKGELKQEPRDPKVWFNSKESFYKVFSVRNHELLALIAARQPRSITELAILSGREKSNLSRTLYKMELCGFVKLEKGSRGAIMPKVSCTHMELDFYEGYPPEYTKSAKSLKINIFGDYPFSYTSGG